MSLYPSPPSSLKRSADSNLQSFLDSIIPSVPLNLIPKASRTYGNETTNYFNLKDLWECFEEWSAYGVGVPVVLNDGDNVVQYYAPHLSAIQIYTIKEPAILLRPRKVKEEAGHVSSDTDNSSSSSNGEWDLDAMTEHPNYAQVDGNTLGHLYFEYSDAEPLYQRIHLDEKIAQLSREFPGILSFKSIELTPASWMSIAWYPIYQIPMKEEMMVKDLEASFLTYHTLSSYVDGENAEDSTEKGNKEFTLTCFGLASFNVQEEFWINTQKDYDTICSLYNAADSWLKQVKYTHYDFDYFKNH